MFIHFCDESLGYILRHLLRQMNGQSIFFLSIDNPDSLFLSDQYSAITYLSSSLSIERSNIEYQVIEGLVLGNYFPITGDFYLHLGIIISYELLNIVVDQFDPIVRIYRRCWTGTLFLSFHFSFEFPAVNHQPFLPQDQFGQIV